MATIAMAIGIAVAYYTQYIIEMGIPAVQSLFISAIVYLLLMKVKHKIRPDQFTKVE